MKRGEVIGWVTLCLMFRKCWASWRRHDCQPLRADIMVQVLLWTGGVCWDPSFQSSKITVHPLLLFRPSRQPLNWVTLEWPITWRMVWCPKPTCQFVSTSPPIVKMALRPFWFPSRWTMKPHPLSLSGSEHRMWLRCLLQPLPPFILILQVWFVLFLM